MNIIDTMVKTGHLTQEQADSTKRAVDEVLQAAREDWEFSAQLEKAAAVDPAAVAQATAKVMSGADQVAKPGFAPALWGNMKSNARGVLESDLPKYVLLSAAAEGIGALTGGIGSLYDAVKSKFEAHQNYETMLEKNPSLRDNPNKEMIRASFDTLQRFNPAYASDPLVAGTFVTRTLAMEGMDLNALNQLTGTYKQYRDARKEGPGPDVYRQLADMHQDPNEQAFNQWKQLSDIQRSEQGTEAHGWKAQENEDRQQRNLQEMNRAEQEGKDRHEAHEQDMAERRAREYWHKVNLGMPPKGRP